MSEVNENNESCTHDCNSCKENCDSRKESFLADANPFSNVKKVIAVVSGKGGVGKSMVTSALAVSMQQAGYQTAILDADITGPSIPKMFGVHGKVSSDEKGIYPKTSANGTKIMSVNLLLENDTDPVVWRGPIIANTVKQFYSDVVWDDVDYMFVDMPPGTGDVPLTVFQSLPVDGIVVVTSPQELVSMIVKKAVNMAGMMDIPVLGLVENMSYFECPDCHNKHYIFGQSHLEEVAAEYGIEKIVRIPINPDLALKCDAGMVETADHAFMEEFCKSIEI
ncbi:MAG: Mrp/NBP35 family ATP-binding protein [Clostridia bacterium]|nr:Mrp/NBP35 family ATP-binding protein [Clostridia bacterium]